MCCGSGRRCRGGGSLRSRSRCRRGSRRGSYLRSGSGLRAGSSTLVLRAGAGNRLGTSTRGGFRAATRSGGGVVWVLGLDDFADHLHDLLSLLGVAVALLQLDGDLLHVLLHRALRGPGARAVADLDVDEHGSRSRRGRGCCGGILSHGEGRQGSQHGNKCLLHMRV